MRDILDTIKRWRADERAIALATVVKTWGSAPRREGAKMGITDAMAMIGSVSGGCVEGAVVEEALAGLKDGKARLLNFGVADDMAWEVGLTCGGSIEVFVEPLDALWWDALADLAERDKFRRDGHGHGRRLLSARRYCSTPPALFSTRATPCPTACWRG